MSAENLTRNFGEANTGLQLWARETQSLFLNYYLLIIALFFHMDNSKPTFAPFILYVIYILHTYNVLNIIYSVEKWNKQV